MNRVISASAKYKLITPVSFKISIETVVIYCHDVSGKFIPTLNTLTKTVTIIELISVHARYCAGCV